MLRAIARLVIIACCAIVVALSLVLWNATGRAGFTRYFDAARFERDRAAAAGGVADLFEGTGVTDGAKPMEGAPNSFALGLAPSAGPLDKGFASVATIAGPAALAALLSLVIGRRGLSQRHGGTEKRRTG